MVKINPGDHEKELDEFAKRALMLQEKAHKYELEAKAEAIKVVAQAELEATLDETAALFKKPLEIQAYRKKKKKVTV